MTMTNLWSASSAHKYSINEYDEVLRILITAKGYRSPLVEKFRLLRPQVSNG